MSVVETLAVRWHKDGTQSKEGVMIWLGWVGAWCDITTLGVSKEQWNKASQVEKFFTAYGVSQKLQDVSAGHIKGLNPDDKSKGTFEDYQAKRDKVDIYWNKAERLELPTPSPAPKKPKLKEGQRIVEKDEITLNPSDAEAFKAWQALHTQK